MMPRAMGTNEGHRAAGAFEIWAARAWNVFNEGRPFSVVYPLLVLLCAAPLGLAPDGPLLLALAGTLALAWCSSRFEFPLRGRALLWLVALASIPLLEPWRALPLLAGALAGYAFFTVVLWGSIYYHLRTGAPWTNGLRFWRLVLTNSDPTSGNALEQVPKLVMTLSAGNLLAEDADLASVGLDRDRRRTRGRGGHDRLALVRAHGACRAIRRRAEAASSHRRRPLARRVYVIVVDGCNRGRLWQAHTPGDGPARPRGHGVPGRGARPSGADGGLLLVDAHGRRARRARHALELRAAARRAPRVGLRRARAPRPPRPARGDRAPARPVRRGGGALGDLGAAHRRDRPLALRGGAARGGGGGPRPARAPAAGRRPARPRARRAQPRVPRPARGHGPPGRRVPELPRGARQARGRDRDPDGRPRPGPRHRRPWPPRLGRAPGAVRGLGSRSARPAP